MHEGNHPNTEGKLHNIFSSSFQNPSPPSRPGLFTQYPRTSEAFVSSTINLDSYAIVSGIEMQSTGRVPEK